VPLHRGKIEVGSYLVEKIASPLRILAVDTDLGKKTTILRIIPSALLRIIPNAV